MVEAGLRGSRGHAAPAGQGMVAYFGLSWRKVADGLEEPANVEPVDPFLG